jgi:Uma2 family endonuclease
MTAMSTVTPDEYLERERASDTKHEYWYGEIFAMAGGTPVHSFIINNIQATLTFSLRGKKCFVFNDDLRVAVRWDALITYPDVTVVCGLPKYADEKRDTVVNPILVAEVLSPSTTKSDRGEKAFLYRQLPSLREILLVEPSRVWVEHSWRLESGNWEIETITDPVAIMRLSGVGCDLPLVEIYRDSEIFLEPS